MSNSFHFGNDQTQKQNPNSQEYQQNQQFQEDPYVQQQRLQQQFASEQARQGYNMQFQNQQFQNPQAQAINYDPELAGSVMQDIMKKVFIYMFSGLIITGIIAVAGMLIPSIYYIVYTNPMILMVAALAQLGVVFAFTFAARKAKAGTAKVLFYVYSVLSGITLAVYLSYFTMQSVALAFVISALTFGGMAVWGYKTKRDLSAIGQAGRMLLIGAIIATVVNVVLYFVAPGIASALDMILNYVVVAIFVGLTAYDMQKIRMMAENSGVYNAGSGPEAVAVRDTVAINGALNLYLDFINIFIRLLSIFGRRR